VQVDADQAAEHSTSPENISQRAIAVDSTRRTQLLRQLVKQGENQPEWERALVFVAKRHTAEMLADKLYKAGIYATTFHGDMSQGARKDVLDQFKAKRWQLLITTDLAARGIDIAQLPTVINYDLPRSPADYIHRIGRTGRAGHAGCAITFVSPADTAHWKLICKRNQLEIDLEQIQGFRAYRSPAATAGCAGWQRRHQGPQTQQEGQAARCSCSRKAAASRLSCRARPRTPSPQLIKKAALRPFLRLTETAFNLAGRSRPFLPLFRQRNLQIFISPIEIQSPIDKSYSYINHIDSQRH
jgi:superfamily II DNA/RNA helicase